MPERPFSQAISGLSRRPNRKAVNATKLREAVEALDRAVGDDGTRELVVIRHGRMIWKGEHIDKRHGVWSCTKSFTSTVLGLLIADGKCTLDTRVADVLPEMQELYPDVTLRHLTTMTSGYRAVGDETTGSYKHGPSGTPFQPNPRPLFTPTGSQYAYWDSAMNVLGLALTKIAGEPIEEVFRRRVATPIGMKDWDWGDYATIDGIVVNGGSGNGNKHVFITAMEMARFGLLFLNNGNWNGQQLVAASWVNDATRVHVPANIRRGHIRRATSMAAAAMDSIGGAMARSQTAHESSRLRRQTCFGHRDTTTTCALSFLEWDVVIVRLGVDGNVKDEVWNVFLQTFREALDADSSESREAKKPDESFHSFRRNATIGALQCSRHFASTVMAKKKKTSSKRELIDTGRDKRYVRRDDKGEFKESDDVGRSLSADRRKKAKRKSVPGQGDKGDR